MNLRDKYNARAVYANQRAIKFFLIDVNKQNPDDYDRHRVDRAIGARENELTEEHTVQTDRGLFHREKKKKYKYQPSKLLYIGIGMYLIHKKKYKWAAALVVLYFVHRWLAKSGRLERWIDGVSSNATTTTAKSRALNPGSTHVTGTGSVGVNFNTFDTAKDDLDF